MPQCVIALSGPMCAGKNCATDILVRNYGFAAIDADVVCHHVLNDLQPLIISTFKKEADSQLLCLTNADGTLNRRALGALLFARPDLLAAHEHLIHPVIDTRIETFIKDHAEQPVVINATVLYKTPSMLRCSALIYVDAPFIIRFFRAKKRDAMPIRQILQRFSAQKDLFTQYSSIISDIYKVRNCGSRMLLARQLQIVMRHL